MKKNYKMLIQYEGTRYQGWQKQTSTENTIQGKIETLLSKMVGAKIEINGSGRTDSGVHARGQVINVILVTQMSCEEIICYMNEYLPEDIGVIAVHEAPERFHARLLAKGKIYQYHVINSKLPYVFDRRYAYEIPCKLQIDAMNKASEYLCGRHDFKSFTSQKKGKKSTVRTIETITIEQKDDSILFVFKGDGFLFHMVRIIMGTLLEIGKGNVEPIEILSIMAAKNREKAGPLVPAKGLTLIEVLY